MTVFTPHKDTVFSYKMFLLSKFRFKISLLGKKLYFCKNGFINAVIIVAYYIFIYLIKDIKRWYH